MAKAKITKRLPNLKDLFEFKLKALYDIEQELVKALPKMAEAATDTDLKAGFEEHLEQTKEHVARIEQSFQELGIEPETTKVSGIRGLITDAELQIKMLKVGTVRDAALVAAAMEAEHYEIAAYGAAIEWAGLLGFTNVQEIFEETLSDEQKTADKLAELGASNIFEEALGSDENTEEGDTEDETPFK